MFEVFHLRVISFNEDQFSLNNFVHFKLSILTNFHKYVHWKSIEDENLYANIIHKDKSLIFYQCMGHLLKVISKRSQTYGDLLVQSEGLLSLWALWNQI